MTRGAIGHTPAASPVARPTIAMVSFESLSRSTAAGNHIEAVREALEPVAEVVVCGATTRRSIKRYALAIRGWWRARHRSVVYLRAHPVAPLIAIGARLWRQRLVLEVNGPVHDITGAHERVRWMLPVLSIGQRLAVRLAHDVVVPTPGLASLVRAMATRVPVHVIPAGFDDSVFHPVTGSEPERRVVFVGANAVWQGVDDLIAATSDSHWPQGVDVLIVGPFDHGTLPRTADGGGVELVGALDPADVASLLRSSLAAVSPKRYRGAVGSNTGQAPLKVFEAMGSGVPCIVTEIPIQDELIRTHGCGIVVPPGDPAAIAAAVATYASDPGLRERHAANARAAAPAYSWSRLASQTRAAVVGERT